MDNNTQEYIILSNFEHKSGCGRLQADEDV